MKIEPINYNDPEQCRALYNEGALLADAAHRMLNNLPPLVGEQAKCAHQLSMAIDNFRLIAKLPIDKIVD